jgi:hypothetical protein
MEASMATEKAGRRLPKPNVARARKSKTSATRVRKNMDMDPAKLRAAQQALGTESETETVDRALEVVIGRQRLGELMDRFAARGGLRAYDAQA